jgi:hypothetical protein
MSDLRRIGIFRDLLSRESVLRMMQRHRLMSQREHNLRFRYASIRVTGSPCTTSGSQSEGVQSEGAEASGSQSVETSPEAVTLGQRDLTSPLTTSGKRRPRWFRETLKEAKENLGEPKSQIRESRSPVRFGAYMALVTSITDTEPQAFAQAVDQQVWREAMVEEYDSIVCNDVWEVVPRPVGKSVVTSRWLYKTKYAANGSIEKHKARFVARGFSQIKGVDYDETFASVARYTSIKSIIAIAQRWVGTFIRWM